MTSEGDLAELLARYKPHRVDAVMADETRQRVAVPTKGQRWSRMASTLATIPWVELHCLNARSELVAPVITRGPATEMEPLAGPDVSHGGAGVLQVNAIAQMFSQMVRETMRTSVDGLTKMRDAARGEMRDILEAHKDLARDFAQQLAVQTRRRMELEDELEAARAELAALRAEISAVRSAGDSERGGMIERIVEAQAAKMLGLDAGEPASAADKPKPS